MYVCRYKETTAWPPVRSIHGLPMSIEGGPSAQGRRLCRPSAYLVADLLAGFHPCLHPCWHWMLSLFCGKDPSPSCSTRESHTAGPGTGSGWAPGPGSPSNRQHAHAYACPVLAGPPSRVGGRGAIQVVSHPGVWVSSATKWWWWCSLIHSLYNAIYIHHPQVPPPASVWKRVLVALLSSSPILPKPPETS